MNPQKETLYQEIDQRIEKTKEEMRKRRYDGLIVYGTNKVNGSLRYLTDYFPDRAGWTSLGPDTTFLFEGAAFVIPAEGDPVLMIDPGLFPGRDIHTKEINVGGLSSEPGSGLSGKNIAGLLMKRSKPARIGIESFDRFTVSLFQEIRNELPTTEVVRSTIVEELRMVKSPWELEMFKAAAAIGDIGSKTIFEMLKNGFNDSELELIRAAENAMRLKDPIYEDSCTGSPSLIGSGSLYGGSILHLPDADKKIREGDWIHWDICQRYNGYPIDTSRTRVLGKASDEQKHAYIVNCRMLEKVLESAKPGTKACDLVILADKVAQESGFELWLNFLGHGLGMDTHERPDLVVEATRLKKDMVIAIEPRILLNNTFLFGIEEMVHITEDGGVSLTQFPNTPLEIL